MACIFDEGGARSYVVYMGIKMLHLDSAHNAKIVLLKCNDFKLVRFVIQSSICALCAYDIRFKCLKIILEQC